MRYAGLTGFYLPGDFVTGENVAAAIAKDKADIGSETTMITLEHMKRVSLSLPIEYLSIGYSLLEEGLGIWNYGIENNSDELVQSNFLFHIFPPSVYVLIAVAAVAYALVWLCMFPGAGFVRCVYRAVSILLKEPQPARGTKREHTSSYVRAAFIFLFF